MCMTNERSDKCTANSEQMTGAKCVQSGYTYTILVPGVWLL